jgi:hypothetical protein
MTTTPRANRLAVLRGLLTVAIAESFVHYLDNTLRYRDYAGPNPPAISSWIARWMIPVSWVLFTAIAVIGYRRFREARWSRASAWLAVYSLSGLVSIGHYAGISVSDLSVFQNVFVFADIAAGVAVLAFAVSTARTSAAPYRRLTSTAPPASRTS